MTLVYPCKCQGSVRYVHEECLKTWIVAQHKDIFTAKCELCHTSLRQEIEIAHQCHCEDLCQQNKLVTFCSLLCLLILTVAVAVVLYFFTAK
jgi:E3 ubiquitin-protein ligase DOA10